MNKTTLIWILVLAISMASSAFSKLPDKWFDDGQLAVKEAKKRQPITTPAKNVILFVGDGMGVSTITAARILEGQLQGKAGEEHMLSFDLMPYTAISKTYNTNQQVPDSAGTMTAIVTGTKTKAGVLSVNQNVIRRNAASVKGNELTTIIEQAAAQGRATGIVSTARITHATPAACYAHSPERDWEDDSVVARHAPGSKFPDIARQLIEQKEKHRLQVALGGGRANFLPVNVRDPEYPSKKAGRRKDGRDLTKEWMNTRKNASYVWNRSQFEAIDSLKTDHLLGLFEPSHMQYEVDRENDGAGEPSLSEMTKKAIELLKRNPKGFVLMVEGARIDHAHHSANAYRALHDTIEFAHAVKVAIENSDRKETLVIVTADHSHVFSLGGYPTRGNPILGKVVENDDYGNPGKLALDGLGLPYTTAGYANGPGYTGASSLQKEGLKSYPHDPKDHEFQGIKNGRPKEILATDTETGDYLQESTVPLASETHGAEDVIIYADGPMAYLFSGVQEQNYIYHVMAEALEISHD